MNVWYLNCSTFSYPILCQNQSISRDKRYVWGQKKDQNNVFDISQEIQRTRKRKRYQENKSFTRNHNISTEKVNHISIQGNFCSLGGILIVQMII